MKTYLIDGTPRQFIQELADAIGLHESIVLQQIYSWVEYNKSRKINFVDGRYWTYNSIAVWHQEYFSYWSEKTVRNTFKSLRDKKILLAKQLNTDPRNRELWYSVDIDKLHDIVREYQEKQEKKICSQVDTVNFTECTYQNEQSEGKRANDVANLTQSDVANFTQSTRENLPVVPYTYINNTKTNNPIINTQENTHAHTRDSIYAEPNEPEEPLQPVELEVERINSLSVANSPEVRREKVPPRVKFCEADVTYYEPDENAVNPYTPAKTTNINGEFDPFRAPNEIWEECRQAYNENLLPIWIPCRRLVREYREELKKHYRDFGNDLPAAIKRALEAARGDKWFLTNEHDFPRFLKHLTRLEARFYVNGSRQQREEAANVAYSATYQGVAPANECTAIFTL